MVSAVGRHAFTYRLMRPQNTERRTQVREMYARGLSLRAIAKELGCTHQAVHELLARMGIPRRPRGGNQGSHSRHPA
jgi:DNA invertase Pin-like site-specific DNA recombinase